MTVVSPQLQFALPIWGLGPVLGTTRLSGCGPPCSSPAPSCCFPSTGLGPPFKGRRVAANHSHFSGLVPTLPAPISPCPCSPHADTHPLPPSFRHPEVLCPREWNFLVTSHHHGSFHAKSHTHTFPPPSSGQVPGKGTEPSLFPRLPRSLSLSLLSPSFLLSPPTIHFCPLRFEPEGCWGESSLSTACLVVLGVSSHSSLLSPSPPPLPPTLTAGCHRHHYNPVTDFLIDHSSPLWTAVC